MSDKQGISKFFVRQWNYRGINCGIAKHPRAPTYNGYVQIPKGWNGRLDDLIAHGALINNGLSYRMVSYFKTPIHKLLYKIFGCRHRWSRRFKLYKTLPDEGGWIGFDTWHLHDMERGGWTEKEVMSLVNDLAEQVAAMEGYQ